VTEYWSGDVAVLELRGPLTYVAGTRLLEWVRGSSRNKVLLNLAQVSYLDSAGLGAVIDAHGLTTRRGGALKFLHVTTRIRHMFEITGLLGFFETFESEPAAVASFCETPTTTHEPVASR
jgi:anti-anti-sigma factor